MPESVSYFYKTIMAQVLHSTDSLQLHFQLFIALVRVAASSATIITAMCHNVILKKLAFIDLTSTSVLVRLEILKYLAATSLQTFASEYQSVNTLLICGLVKKLANDNDPIVKSMTLRALKSNKELIGDKDSATASIAIDQQLAALKCNTDVDLIIDRIYSDANSLHKFYLKNMINSEQLSSVNEIVNLLKEIR